MIKSFSSFIINYLIRKDVIRDEIEIYQYGLEQLVSSFIGIFIILTISLATNRFIEGLIYLLSFIFIRKFTGGYHCKTYLSCKVSFIGIFIIYLMSAFMVIPNIVLHYSASLAFLMIWLLAPCDHENKVLSASEKRRYGNISKVIIILYSLMIYVGYQTGSIYTVCMEMMLVIIAVLLIIGKIERRISNEKN